MKINSNISRQIGCFQRIYQFCDKYNIPKTKTTVEDILTSALKTLSTHNFINENPNDLLSVTIRWNRNNIINQGKFTFKQIRDIENMLGCTIYAY